MSSIPMQAVRGYYCSEMLARWVRNPDRFAEVSGADAVGEEHVTGRDAPVEIIDRQGKPLRVREEAEAIGFPRWPQQRGRRVVASCSPARSDGAERRWTRATGVVASFAAITPVRRDSGFRDDRAARSRVATPHPGGVQRARSEFHTPQTTPVNPYCSRKFTHGYGGTHRVGSSPHSLSYSQRRRSV